MNDWRQYWTRPQGNIARWVDVVAVFAAGICSFYSYYLIEFNICRTYNCEDLLVTRYYASASWWYLLFGFALFGVSLFIRKARDLPKMFAIAITISSLSGFFLSGMVVFAMLKEASINA